MESPAASTIDPAQRNTTGMANTLQKALPRNLTSARGPLPRRQGRIRGRRDAAASSVFLLPVAAVFVVLYAIPLAQTIYYSFTDFNGLRPEVNMVGWANYASVFTNPSLITGLGFTLLFTAVSTVLITAFAVPLAVALNKKFFGRTLSRSIFFFVGVPSLVIIGLVWQFIFSPLRTGALNSVLRWFGLDAVPWLADSDLARFCVIFVGLWAHVGWHATLYLAYLQSIPGDLYEQAQLDGANGRQQFWHITLPELVPAIVVSSFLLMTSGLKVFDLPFAMTKGGPGYSTNTITQSILVEGLSQSDYGLGSALAVLFTLACLTIILLQLLAARALTRRFE
ncbi:carbohydrate ABC transporter permease [Paenarthrobacter sp. NPDC018779]|uniref:carbohydrate ABC transporter permease n=1 Tax=Paenarthrobacter sp. NPDC018779 TaxID=3364375 RepID=UPI0037CABB33